MCNLLHFHHPSLHFVHNTFALILHSIQSLSILIMVSMALCSYILIMRTRWQGRCIDCLIDKLLACILIDSIFSTQFPFYSNFHFLVISEMISHSFVVEACMETRFLFIACFYFTQNNLVKRLSVLAQHGVMPALIIILAKKVKMSLSA